MKLLDYKGIEFHLPTSGGKAGKGCAATGTIQARHGNRIVKQFRFKMGESRAAIHKAKLWADRLPTHGDFYPTY